MKHLNLLAFVIFSLALAWVFMIPTEAKRKIQRPILAMFGMVNKTANAITVDEDVVNGVNLAPAELAEKYDKKELSERYSYLLREVMELRAIKSQYAQIQRDNKNLRDSLGFTRSPRGQSLQGLVPARVIKRESSTWWSELWINKGENSGIVLDSPVLTTTHAEGGEEARPALIGKVVGVSETTARVLLLTDERCKVAARVEGTRESGLLMGSRAQDGTPVLKLRYLSKGAKELESRANAMVLSSDAGGVVPLNFLLGSVQRYESLEFYGEATVAPAVKFTELTDVFVILPEDEAKVLAEAEKADAAAAAKAVPRAAIPVNENTPGSDPAPGPGPDPDPDPDSDSELGPEPIPADIPRAPVVAPEEEE